jgi:hypothetical protein
VVKSAIRPSPYAERANGWIKTFQLARKSYKFETLRDRVICTHLK